MASKWYSIRMRSVVAAAAIAAAAGAQTANAKSAEILIYGDIGDSWWSESVSAAQFVRELNALDADDITVRINSIGGSVPDGIAIHNAMKRHKATITTVIDGMALSIASLIALGGDRVEMAENAAYMVHAPWTYAAGNSAELRDVADMLDTWAGAMSTSYASKTGKPEAEMLGLLTDGKDHWYTAAEAKEAGYVDEVISAMPVAAMARASGELNRFRDVPAWLAARATPAAAAAPISQEPSMTQAVNQPSQAPTPPQPVLATPPAAPVQGGGDDPARAAGVQAEANRRRDIRAAFQPFAGREGMDALLRECEDDVQCTVAAANGKILAALAKGATPAAGGYVVVEKDETDKFREAAVQAIMARGAVVTKDGPVRADGSNPLRGHKLLDIARACLVRAGVRVDGMDQRAIVAAAFTQSTSDFPLLLENTMHKTLLSAYAIAPDTWTRFCKRGSVSDFRQHKRYRVGSMSNLDAKNELGEFKTKAIPDGERSSIQAATKGNIINLSRETIINDDLEALTGLSGALGRAAKRTVEADVYATLALNSGLGPTLEDGKSLFHADHGNIGTPAANTVAAWDEARAKMAQQKDPSGNDFLDLRPAVWLGPTGLGGTARVLNGAEYDPDTANKLQKPNMVRGLVGDIVDTPRLSGTPWYLFADPMDAAVLEVAFLDGVDTPYLEQEAGFTVDGVRWKVRLDYGVAGIDYRGAVRNAGQ